MVKSVNKVILIGNLGFDPELQHLQNGNTVVTVFIATTVSWKETSSEKFQERTEWHRVILYNKLAMSVEKYLHKGIKVYVEGFLRTNKWKDKSGIFRYTTEIIANSLLVLSILEKDSIKYEGFPQKFKKEKKNNEITSRDNCFVVSNNCQSEEFFEGEIPF